MDILKKEEESKKYIIIFSRGENKQHPEKKSIFRKDNAKSYKWNLKKETWIEWKAWNIKITFD